MPKPKTKRKPSSPTGNIHLRLDPATAKAAQEKADAQGVSRNTYLADLIAADVRRAA